MRVSACTLLAALGKKGNMVVVIVLESWNIDLAVATNHHMILRLELVAMLKAIRFCRTHFVFLVNF